LPAVALFVHRSNRTEALVTALAEVLGEPLRDPLAVEPIAVQGSGMERWLMGQLASRFGVWAQPSFPYPRAAAELVLDALLGPAGEESTRFSPDALTLRIAGLLPHLLDDPDFSTFRSYLQHDPGGIRLVSLASQLAQSFDRYAVYRPDFLLDFERGRGDAAQGKIWCALSEGAREAHFSARVARLARHNPADEPHGALPERLCLFGLSALAPSLLSVFRAAAKHIPVHAFLLVPVAEYYDDLDRSQRMRRDVSSLVSRFGRMIRELDHDLRELEGPEVSVSDLLEPPEAAHALAQLQCALLELDGADAAPAALEASDDSLRVNVCTSRTRELEVLRDELRGRFEDDSTLAPRDVVVLVPDIESYALAIEAVFGEQGTSGDIPYRIADASASRHSAVATALFEFVELVRGRCTLSALLDFLHAPAVRNCLALDDETLARFEQWLEGAGARFGLDSGQRTRIGLSADETHTMGFALDRLLLGLTLPDAAVGTFAHVAPAVSTEGKASESLGKLARILRSIRVFAEALAVRRTLAAHAQILVRVVDQLLDGTQGEEPYALVIKQGLLRIAAESTTANAISPVDVASVMKLLDLQLEGKGAATAFLTGSVTFCQHVPMRAIPFRVVCMLGMDDSAFPRAQKPQVLDLSQARPRRGDRNVRDDDRQLFLDALLCARDAFVLSYVSEAEGGGEHRGPSSAVVHLLRAVDAHFQAAPAEAASDARTSDRLVVHHARLAFDPRYFTTDAGPLRRSFDARALSAARSLVGKKAPRGRFVSAPLAPDILPNVLEIATLVRFFKHPQKAFLQRRVALRLWEQDASSDDREPVLLEGLERYGVGARLLTQLDGMPGDARAELLSRSGSLPKGMLGLVQLRRIEHTSAILQSAAAAGAAQPCVQVDLPLSASGLRLSGQLDGMHTNARAVVVFGKLTPRRKLTAWLEHVALSSLLGSGAHTLLVGRKDEDEAERRSFGFVSNASEILDGLVALYCRGQCDALPLFPDASYAYAAAMLGGKSEADAFARAKAALFAKRAQGATPENDAYLLQAFPDLKDSSLADLTGSDPSLDFASLALQVFGPLIAAEKASEGT
jgi:exodeoxyribonuclease V gamma subunit